MAELQPLAELQPEIIFDPWTDLPVEVTTCEQSYSPPQTIPQWQLDQIKKDRKIEDDLRKTKEGSIAAEERRRERERIERVLRVQKLTISVTDQMREEFYLSHHFKNDMQIKNYIAKHGY